MGGLSASQLLSKMSDINTSISNTSTLTSQAGVQSSVHSGHILFEMTEAELHILDDKHFAHATDVLKEHGLDQHFTSVRDSLATRRAEAERRGDHVDVQVTDSLDVNNTLNALTHCVSSLFLRREAGI